MAHSQQIEDSLVEQLPLPYRLALSYAPAGSRDGWLTALAFDARLGAALRQASEPVMAQLRLAWWRDRLGEAGGAMPAREPLLARLRALPPSPSQGGAGLVALVDGWEALLEEAPISDDAIQAFVSGRVALIAALAAALSGEEGDHGDLARHWALADLAIHLTDPGERQRVLALLPERGASRVKASRAMRPLSVLAHLSLTSARKGQNRILHSPWTLFSAMRIGIFG